MLRSKAKLTKKKNNRPNIVLAIIFLFNFLIVLRLFNLQIINGAFFAEASLDQHSIYQKLLPERGKIFLEDYFSHQLYPVAVNHKKALIYSDNRKIKDPEKTAKKLTEILKPLWLKEYEDFFNTNSGIKNFSVNLRQQEEEEFLQNKIKILKEKLSKKNDPYEILARKVPEKKLKEILELQEPGIGYIKENFRYYPEAEILSHVSGFVGYGDEGPEGKYGVEGYFNEILKGKEGFFAGEKDALGYFLIGPGSKIIPAQDGDDLVLTIDRAVQFKVCNELKESVKSHGADGGLVVVMDPENGEIIAMCGVPSYDANYYYQEKDFNIFNNPVIFNQYEPGSIFKPITVAAGLNEEKISPYTTYYDQGCVKVGVETICNSDLKSHKIQNMTNVLEKSLNTGTIFILNQIGKNKFKKYVKDFGFGQATGIELKGESSGNIDFLDSNNEIYSATASFGQGISVTPLQMANAFAAIANGGVLLRPHIVKRFVKNDGLEEKVFSQEIRRVISRKTATLLSGMLVSVVENGHGKKAGVSGYYVAGKTGTAQVPKKEGGYYKDRTIGSFIGFAPAENPRFVMLVRIDNPKDVIWAESSAAPLFGKLAKIILEHYEIKPERKK